MTTDRADRLAAIAREMITRVRDDAPVDVWRWLRLRMADLAGADPIDDWIALSVIQAAATPDDRPWSELTAWAGEPPTTPDPERIERRRAQWREAKRRSYARQHSAQAVQDGAA